MRFAGLVYKGQSPFVAILGRSRVAHEVFEMSEKCPGVRILMLHLQGFADAGFRFFKQLLLQLQLGVREVIFGSDAVRKFHEFVRQGSLNELQKKGVGRNEKCQSRYSLKMCT